MTREPLDSITSDSGFSRSIAACTSASDAFSSGLRLFFWLQPAVSAFCDNG